ncbi:hypothetical protein BDV25DRAFT_145262 [Aspergillus avenaceus]|uniref:Restriction endonuclease domain-containing protein n=1 Tax=Aspergillus avenaceus TaxID=36643 RepID=A0A5N6TFB8_ASPAV|nr:hypothetical protein BDV25DRAFT_145262 [Aspergillus avenaceus]
MFGRQNNSTWPNLNITLPSTPPSKQRQPSAGLSVWNAIRIFQDLKDPHSEACHDGQKTIKLPPEEYLQLLRTLDCEPLQEFVSDKVRWDYDPKAGLLYIRTPTPVHNFFASSIAAEIYKQLQCIANVESAAGKFAGQISNGGSSRIYLKEDDCEGEPGNSKVFLQHQPDAQFQYHGTAYPGVVLEVSYAQKGKSLQKLARHYILHSNGNIKVVIGVAINSLGTNESTVSLWRPSYIQEGGEEFDILDVQQEIKSQPFRAQDGSYANQAQSIHLDLSDFAPDQLSADIQGIQLEITFEKLAYFLGLAEHMHRLREISPGIKSERKTRKRKLSPSSAEE